jgi:hypothetical protein
LTPDTGIDFSLNRSLNCSTVKDHKYDSSSLSIRGGEDGREEGEGKRCPPSSLPQVIMDVGICCFRWRRERVLAWMRRPFGPRAVSSSAPSL